MSEITFNCPSCKQGLEADAADAGSHIRCPECNSFIIVPVRVTDKTVDDDHGSRLKFKPLSQGNPTETKNCPECGTDLGTGAIFCVNCGLNLISGRRMSTTSQKRSPIGMNILLSGLIIAGIGGGLVWWKVVRHTTTTAITPEVASVVDSSQSIRDMLSKVIITADFEFRQANMLDVVAFLNKVFKEESGSGAEVVNFILAMPKGVPIPEITMAGHNIPMDQILDLIVEAANCSYQFSNNVVIISPAEEVPLECIRGNGEDRTAMRQLLSTVIVDEVEFRQAHIYDIVDFLNHIFKAKAPKGITANIVLIPQKEGSPGVKPISEITMAARYIRLSTVMDVITYVSGCSWTADGNVAIIRNDCSDLLEKDLIPEDEDMDSSFVIGNSQYYGWDGPVDFKEAVQFYRKAADQGHIEAQYMMGHCLFTGAGIDKDEAAAMVWWEKASVSNLNARTSLGLCYLNGRGVQKDLKKGIEYLHGSADDGDNIAQYYLGCQYFAEGQSTNIDTAFFWLEQSAGNGNSNAVVAIKKMKGTLAADAVSIFKEKKTDPYLLNNTNLASVAKAMVRMADRTVFPTKTECESLLVACDKLLDGNLSNDVRRAVMGSQLRMEYEQEMLEKGLERYAGVFMDKDSIARARQSVQSRMRELSSWQQRQEPETERVVRQFGSSKEAESYRRSLSKTSNDPRYFVRQKGGERWEVCVRDNVEKSQDFIQRNQAPRQSPRQSSGTSTVTLMPAGSVEHDDYMRRTFGGRIGVTRNAGAFGPMINPGGINW